MSAKGNVENLYYNESALYIGILGIGKVRNDKREYEMRLVDGKVASFGEVGEYIEEDDGSDSIINGRLFEFTHLKTGSTTWPTAW